MKEAAKGLVSKLLPEPDARGPPARPSRRDGRGAPLRHHQHPERHGDADEFALYDELRKANELTRAHLLGRFDRGAARPTREADELDALWKKYADDPVFKIGAVKLMGDGVIESHTAAMLAPYANKPQALGRTRRDRRGR